MSKGMRESRRIVAICDELAKYGIEATPSVADSSWLLIHAPSTVANEDDLLWGTPPALRVLVSDEDLLRPDCLELVLGKVTSVTGHPC